jgi:hypothetical protein
MSNFLSRKYYAVLLQLFLRLGTKLFNVVVTYAPDGRETITVIHFAMRERDLNCSVRGLVDGLDASYSPERRNKRGQSFSTQT